MAVVMNASTLSLRDLELPRWVRIVLPIYLSVAVVSIGAVLITWLAGGAGSFWPGWTLLGFALPLAVLFALERASHAPPGRARLLAAECWLCALLAVVVLLVWLLAGAHAPFWPIWVWLALGAWFLAQYVLTQTSRIFLTPHEEELTERVEELTRTRRGALDVQAAELRRIERDLHDGAQARLVALSMKLGRAEDRVQDQPDVAELLREAREEAGAAIGELRDLARGIAPPVLADRGLEAAVVALGERAPMAVQAEVDVAERPPPVVETAAYFVVAESLTNVAKHGGGAGARVQVVRRDGELSVAVSDDGPGGADPDGGGLAGLRGRVEALDGTLAVESPIGGGTCVRARLPCGP
jgi:signal transduction histidine kinase